MQGKSASCQSTDLQIGIKESVKIIKPSWEGDESPLRITFDEQAFERQTADF